MVCLVISNVYLIYTEFYSADIISGYRLLADFLWIERFSIDIIIGINGQFYT